MSTSLDALGRAVKQLQTKHHRMLDIRLTEIGSSLAQWDALRAVHRNPGASSHALAEYTFQTDQSFGALAARLVDKGLVSRSAGKGRAICYVLTASGEDIRRRGASIAAEVFSASFAPLDEDERAVLLSLLERLMIPASNR
ncbi:MarR family winged helix-turn-helix transcriptional regulator [Consotaella aegiceratis]|uniref:MarR family winged helix-turn-helix transcriptional regulator n=1 Tax=Consotaella aegiceratis TaxID=3097961 RepID=UPI002F3E9F6E